jgi:hypothetical protein
MPGSLRRASRTLDDDGRAGRREKAAGNMVAPGQSLIPSKKEKGLQGIEWVILRDHSGGNACG